MPDRDRLIPGGGFSSPLQHNSGKGITPPALTLEQARRFSSGIHQKSGFAPPLRIDGPAVGRPEPGGWPIGSQRFGLRQQPLPSPGDQATEDPCAKKQDGSDAWACLHVVPEGPVILLPPFRTAMSSSSHGRWQRQRTLLAFLLAMLVWGFRWLWPLQLLPGWVVALLFAWVGIELIALMRFPRRWR